MIASLRAEFRKVFTVRSTYGWLLFVLLMLIFFAFYIEGIRASGDAGSSPDKLASEVTSAIGATSVFISIIGALLVTHEYRFNTILYTLTASKSRLRVMLSKILVITGFSLVVTLAVACLSPLFTYLGLMVHGAHLVPQTIPYGDLLWRSLFVGWGYSMLGLLFASLIRNQVGVIVAIFLFQGTVEPLLTLLLKHNAVYLPYRALNSLLESAVPFGLTHAKSAAVFLTYLAIGWLVAFVLFMRRDAN